MGNEESRSQKENPRKLTHEEMFGSDLNAPPPLCTVPYEIEQFTDRNHKELVLQILSDKTLKNRWMGELRMTLFAAAAASATKSWRTKTVNPFPACFFDKERKRQDVRRVVKAIEEVPELVNINETTILDPLTWELLYWVFTNPLTLEPLTEDIGNQIKEMRSTTGLELPIPDNVNIWMFNIKHTQPKLIFTDAKLAYGSFYGFHGSSIENFHSIIHRGFMCSYNVRAAYENGTYLASLVETAKDTWYASKGNGWAKSAFGQKIQCVAVCEVISSPDHVYHHGDFCDVCDKDDYMQLSHLYVFKVKNMWSSLTDLL